MTSLSGRRYGPVLGKATPAARAPVEEAPMWTESPTLELPVAVPPGQGVLPRRRSVKPARFLPCLFLLLGGGMLSSLVGSLNSTFGAGPT